MDSLDIVTKGIFTEETADQLNQYVLDTFANSDDIYAAAEQLGSEIARGTLDGIEIDPESREALMSSIFNFLDQEALDAIAESTFGRLDDMERITDISQKNGQYTKEDLDFLRQYPGVLTDIANGEFDINEFKKQQTEEALQQLKLERARFLQLNGTRIRLLENRLATEELDERQIQSIENQIAGYKELAEDTMSYYDLMEDAVNSSGTNDFLDAQKQILDLQKTSIERARALRDLQKEAAEVVSKSIQATRIGAVGSIEAQFNQSQLNQEIAAANRRLEEEIMMAQIEAQQKILEDAQQKQILEATADNTDATNTNSDRLRILTDAVNRVLTPTSRLLPINTGNIGGDDQTYNAVVGQN
jgi:hypothetical protein